jgi:CheY-like chemotaxis protein
MGAQELSVLIVDDSEDDARLAVCMLEDAEYEVRSLRVQSDQEMADAIGRRHWDLVLCENLVRGFDLIDALGVLDSGGLHLPVIAVSGARGRMRQRPPFAPAPVTSSARSTSVAWPRWCAPSCSPRSSDGLSGSRRSSSGARSRTHRSAAH